tara:strand:- start:652 stop:789 length:138 start_codon:yes stop_codon:yes gene_type:complete
MISMGPNKGPSILQEDGLSNAGHWKIHMDLDHIFTENHFFNMQKS